MQSEAGGRDFSHHPDTGARAFACVCVFHKSFKLLSSHTNIPLTKKVCRLSETRRIFKENIFPQLFIYFSFPPPTSPPSPTQSWQFSSASSALISRILACVTFFLFFLFPVRGEGKDEAQLVAAISARRFAVYRSQTTPCALQRP